MYHSYFGLKEQVFSIAVDPHYLYMSNQHREALAHLLYGVNSGGFVLLTGEVGTGKTTIVRCLLEQLPAQTELAIVLNPVASAPELLCNICDEFRIPYHRDDTSIKTLMDKLYHYLLDNHTRGRNTVLLIDEAQLLRVSTLEQIRLLTNLETNTRKLLQIILVGQPELNRVLAKPSLRQLSQRITARYHLRALTLEETHSYIAHRLHVAGMKKSSNPFPADVIKVIHTTSRGIPRLINLLCDRMLLGAYSRDTNRVDADVCRQARLEVLGEEAANAAKQTQTPPLPIRRWLPYTGWASAAALAALLVWQVWPGKPVPVMAPVVTEIAEQPQEELAGMTPQPVSEPAFQAVTYSDESQALARLFTELETSATCEDAQLQCERTRLASWNELQKLDRPAVLRLISPAKHELYAVLVGLGRQEAAIRFGGELHHLPLNELGPLWTGDVIYTWHRPDAFTEAVGIGSRGAVVDWLADQFAELDGQRERLARGHFNQALAERVKIFQRAQELQADGIFGARTLMALNQQLGIDKRLLQIPDDQAAVIPTASDISDKATK